MTRLATQVKKLVGRTWLRAFGWEFDPTLPPRRAVVVAAPHTSNWDFPFTIAVSWSLGLDIAWLGKHTLFEPPFGALFRALGGIPVDRRAAHNLVAQVSERLRHADELLVIVPPEGTRTGGGRWKTGFYWIAHEAQVPIVLGYLDFGRRRGGFGTVLQPSGDLARDGAVIQAFYRDIQGKHPDRFSEVSFVASSAVAAADA
ncbi:MAG: 1-acyl-sn-glycerol-3-phosphate acyltransferase [Kofleriaceae bacterium]|nr:1-acyl-sn-glycerol-3-phosphate acyltransferase [Kofleriaceae bacterium]MBP6840729.1 1-acyl-sn-glycerol-3-phosphate acyltransferase [Kofleriaceae bacterium]